jgi:cell division transport system permease protein
VSAYLSASASDEEVRELQAALRRSDGVLMAEIVSPDRAREELLGEGRNAILEALPLEAFPSSIEVTLSEAASRERASEVAEMLARMPAVESVESYEGWTRRIRELVQAAGVVAWALAGVVFLSVVAVVASTTRLSLHRRRDEVEVLRYVGATVGYVRGPFLLEGAVQGALGALLALLSSSMVFWVLDGAFAEEFVLLLGTYPRFLPWTHWLALPCIGALLGALAANASLRRAFSS